MSEYLQQNTGTACTCFWVDPKYWTTHYGAVEPGSTMEPNPDCPEHFPRPFFLVEYFGRLEVHQPVRHNLINDQVFGSATTTYLCTGCSWTVEAYRAAGAETGDAVHRAFAKHLLTTAAEAEP